MAVTALSGQRWQGSSTASANTTITITKTGTTTFTPEAGKTINYVIVGGGGGGGRDYYSGQRGAGGGGAGAYRESGVTSGDTAFTSVAESYTITIGAGGVAGGITPSSTCVSVDGGDGDDSSIGAVTGQAIITSKGGGGGGGSDSGGNDCAGGDSTGSTGGSGGGGSHTGSGGTSGTYGNNGTAGGGGSPYSGGAGGGAGAVGTGTGDSTGGTGGIGLTPSTTYFSQSILAGGGGGSGNTDGSGGSGIGGAGNTLGAGGNGTVNTGSGGGASGAGSEATGGVGGSGIVIISFPIGTSYSTTGSPTVGSAGSQDEKTTVTDVPVGSEFEQTDDYKTYQMAEALVDGADLKCYIKFNDVDTTDPLVNTASSVTGNGSDTLGTDADMILGGAVDPTYAVTAPTDLGTGAMKFFETAGDGTVGSWGNLGTSVSQWKFLHYNSANTSNFPKWTICFWCKMGSDSPNNRNIFRNVSGDGTAGITIYHSDDDVGAGNGGLGIILSSDDGSVGAPPLAFWSASEFFQYDDAWHFYAFTMDFSLSSATLKMWRDMGTTTPAYQTANKGAGALESGNPSYILGFRHYTAQGDNTYIPPTASYSELSIWDRVLTDAELDKIYNSGAGMDLVTGAKIWVERGTAI